MQTLAAGVGDLKKVLTNVKTRGTWGEVQLGESARADADAGAIRQERRDAARPVGARRVRDPPAGPRRRQERHSGCRSTPSFRSRTISACRTRRRGRIWRRRACRQGARGSRSQGRPGTFTTNTSNRRTRPTSRSCICPWRASTRRCLARPVSPTSMQRDYQRDARRPDDPGRDAEQPADGLPDACDRAALERSLEACSPRSRPSSARSATFSPRPRSKLEMVGNTLDAAEVRSRSIERKLRDVEALPEGEADAASARARPRSSIDIETGSSAGCGSRSRAAGVRQRELTLATRQRCSKPSAAGVAGGCSRRPRFPSRCGGRRWTRCRFWRSTPKTRSRACASASSLFLSEKSIVGAAGFDVTPLMRVLIAMQACAPAL